MRRAVLALLLIAAALAAPLTVPATAHAQGGGGCDPGEFCAWTGHHFTGSHRTWDLAEAGIENCVPLPEGVGARSFANRMGRPVTVYQDRECGTEGEFDTYPGGGTWVPESPRTVRAFTVWEH